MTDELFIKEMEDYFFSGEPIGDYSVGRVKGWLKKYRDAIEVPTIVVYKDKMVYVEKVIEMVNGVEIVKKPLATHNEIEREGKVICDAHGVDYNVFIKAKYGKSTCEIVDLRKKFVNHLIQNYDVQRKKIQEYFGVDHTTICYYINNKPYKRKSNGQKTLS